MGVLIQMEAFDSMDLVGEDKLFKNYAQLYDTVVVKGEQIKRALSRKKNRNHKELLAQFIEEAQKIEDWSLEEKLKFRLELSGSVDKSLILTPQIEEFLIENNIEPIEVWANEETNYWGIITSVVIAETRTKKKYLKMKIMGSLGVEFACSLWSVPKADKMPQKNKVIIASFTKNNYGLSTQQNKMIVLTLE